MDCLANTLIIHGLKRNLVWFYAESVEIVNFIRTKTFIEKNYIRVICIKTSTKNCFSIYIAHYGYNFNLKYHTLKIHSENAGF